jgi:hypothetical protein
MNSIPVIKVYDQLSVKLGKETAEGLTTYIKDEIKEEVQSNIKNLATKEDIVSIKGDIAKLDKQISDSKSEILKWMFIFLMGEAIIRYLFK